MKVPQARERAGMVKAAEEFDAAGVETVEHGRVIIQGRPALRWTIGDVQHERTIERRTALGSAPDVDLTIADPAVSRIHAEIAPRPDGLWVNDLGSKNGTFIEDIRIESALLPPGGRLRVGSTILVASYQSLPTPVEVWSQSRFGRLIGGSPPMKELFARLARIAATNSSVLIHGETGTGKELVARSLHEASSRARGPFVVVDCAALPENLLEAELFGHTKGAFTGAAAARSGAIEAADGGTVFLDEIGELPLAVQPKLLRVLEAREVRRLGESAYRPVDVRFICATHRDLRRMVNAGEFREDLFFRLAVLLIAVPPLRERADDIPLLVRHLLKGHERALPDELIAELMTRTWPGNVRELRNFLERAQALGPEEAALGSHHVSAMYGVAHDGDDAAVLQLSFSRPYKDLREDVLEYIEREYFHRLLERHQRDVAAASQEAGVDRTYVYRLIKKHGL